MLHVSLSEGNIKGNTCLGMEQELVWKELGIGMNWKLQLFQGCDMSKEKNHYRIV